MNIRNNSVPNKGDHPVTVDQPAPKAIILLSGGLDSATVLAVAKERGFQPYALSIDYGQRHHEELQACRHVAQSMGVQEHKVLSLDLRLFGGSALTDCEIDVPKHRDASTIGSGAVPVTYVPARNTIFLSLALAWADVLQAEHLFVGVNAVDYSGYPDCRPQFIEAFERLANVATRMGEEGHSIKVHAPLLDLTKAEIIQWGQRLEVDYGITVSCYAPERGLACGTCDACILRREGFAKAGVPDPTRYA